MFEHAHSTGLVVGKSYLHGIKNKDKIVDAAILV